MFPFKIFFLILVKKHAVRNVTMLVVCAQAARSFQQAKQHTTFLEWKWEIPWKMSSIPFSSAASSGWSWSAYVLSRNELHEESKLKKKTRRWLIINKDISMTGKKKVIQRKGIPCSLGGSRWLFPSFICWSPHLHHTILASSKCTKFSQRRV